MMNKWRKRYFKLRNIKAKTIDWHIFILKNPELKMVLKKNKKLKNAYAGKRCFIIGNGPSLSTVDLSLLADEYTFSVNQLPRNKQYASLKTNFHFWADPIFFKIDPNKSEDKELLDVMEGVKTPDNSPMVFFPIEQYGFAKKYDLNKKLDLHYFKTGLIFLEDLKDVDYTKSVPGFGTVVQWCITMAVYMGFSQIYLLGCDTTSIITNINAFMRQKVNDYGYEVSENEQKRLEAVTDNKNLYDYVISYANTILAYNQLLVYCNKRGVELFNCTEPSAIDKIPRRKLSDIL